MGANRITRGTLCIVLTTLVALSAWSPTADAANILMVTNNNTTTQSLVDYLEGKGHTVTRGVFGGGIPDAATLAANDLIIVARESDSGAYDDGTEPQDWNAISLPMINMNMYLYRASRWGWMDGDSLPGLGNQTDYDAYPDPTHPFVNGLTTNLFDSPTAVAGATNPLPPEATEVATLDGGASLGIFEIPAGTTMFNTKGVLGGDRIGFIRGNEDSWGDVSANGQAILDQMIDTTLAPDTIIPEPATMLALAGGLVGLGGYIRRRRK